MKLNIKIKNILLVIIAVIIASAAITTASLTASSLSNDNKAYAEASVWDGTSIDISWYNNYTNVFEINSAAQLAGFRHLTENGASFSGVTIKLTVDIDLGGNKWLPITSFAGTFDGQNHTIQNGELKYTGEDIGFFGEVTSVITVKNVIFENISVVDGDFGVGIVIGKNTADGTIIDNVIVNNCSISTFNTSSFTNYNGFIVAINENNMIVKNSTVSGCSFTCNGSYRYYIGGIIGSANYNSTDTTTKIYSCNVYDCTFGGSAYNFERVGLIASRNSGATMVDGFNTNLICVQNYYNLFGYAVSNVKLSNIDFGFTFKIDDVDISEEYSKILTDYSSSTGNYINGSDWATQSLFTNSATYKRFLEKGGLVSANNLTLSFAESVSSAIATVNGTAVNTSIDGNNVNVILNGAVGNTTVLVTIGNRTHQFNFKTALFEKKTGTVISDNLSYNLAAMGSNPWILDGEVYKSNSAGISYSENGMAFYSEGARYLQFDSVSSSETNYDYINLYIDGEKYEKFINGSGATLASSTYTTYTIDFGDMDYHEVIFAYTKDSGGNIGDDVACVKNVTQPSTFEGIPSVSLLSSGAFYTETTVEGTYADVPAALYQNDTIPVGTTLSYCTETTNPWICDENAEYWASNNATQNSAAMTSSISFKSNGSKYLSFKIASPGEFSSTWGKIFDFATVAIDGVGTKIIATSRFTIEDGIPWQNFYCEFEDDGEHLVTVVFHQDDGNSSPYCALIKDFGRNEQPNQVSIKVQIEGLGSVYVDNGKTSLLCDSAETILSYPFSCGYQYASGNGTTSYFFNTDNLYSISFEAVAKTIIFDNNKYLTPFYKEVLVSEDNGLTWTTYTNEQVANGAIELDLVSDYIVKFVFDYTEQLPVIAIENEGTLNIINNQGVSLINKTVRMYETTEVGKSFIGNTVTVTAPYIDGVNCSVKIGTAEAVVLTSDNIDSGKYFYNFTLSDSTSLTDIAFIYSADGYTTSEFKHSILVTYNIDTDLISSTSLGVEIINDTNLPYEYDLTHSDATHKAFKSGNSANGLNLSLSTIGFRASESGLLSIDVYISTQSYVKSDSGYATRDFVAFSYSNPLTLDSDGWIKFAESSIHSTSSCGGTDTYGCIENDITKSSGNIGWKTITFPITADDVVYLSYYKNIDEAENDDTFAVANVCLRKENVNILYSAQNGTVESTATEKTEIEGGISVPGGLSVTLTATANDGYVFRGWYDTSNNQLVSSDLSYTFNCVGNVSYKALFTDNDNYIRIGGTAYDTLSDALDKANPNDTVYVYSNCAISENTEIPAGVTVLLPYSANDTIGTAVGDASNASARISWINEAQYLYKTLTIDNGAILTVNGNLIVGGVQHYPDQSAQGHTSGAYSQIINDGNIVVNGALNVHGLVKGAGSLTINNGALLKTPFMVNNYSGGTNTSELYEAGQFPFVQFATVNIMCPQTINYGAKVIGSTSLYFWESVHTQDVVLINKYENRSDSDSEGSLIWMHEGSTIDIVYDGNKAVKETVGNINLTDSGVTRLTINGNVTAGEFAINYGSVMYGSADMVLAIPYTYNIVINNGAIVNIPEGRAYKLMPGAKIHLDGELNINGTLYVYDGLIQAEKSGKSYPSAAILAKNGFSSFGDLQIGATGVMNINNTFAGKAQPYAIGAKIVIADGATLSADITDGCAKGYTDNTSTFTLTAGGFGLDDMQLTDFSAGKTYIAYDANSNYLISSFSVTSAASMTYTSEDVSNIYFGGWAEKDTDTTAKIKRTFYIGEAVSDIIVNIGGIDYSTDENGFIKATILFDINKEITYFTKNMDGSKRHTASITFGSEFDTLTEVIKNVELDANNIYTRVFNADGSVKADYILNAVLSYYGTDAKNMVALSFNSDNTEDYSFTKEVTNSEYSAARFNCVLFNATAAITEYINECDDLTNKTGSEIVDYAKNLFNLYTDLTTNRDGDDISFLTNYLAINNVNNDYTEIIVKSAVASNLVTYGDVTTTATLTFINNSTATGNIDKVSYSIEGGVINGLFVYNGTYKNVEYSLEVSVSNVAQKHLDITINNIESVYGDNLNALTYSTQDTPAEGDEMDSIIELTKAEGLNVKEGGYVISGKCINNFYEVSFTNGIYTITPREITVIVNSHNNVMVGHANNIMFNASQTNNGAAVGLSYEIKLDGTLIATVATNGAVSLEPDKDFIANTTYDVFAVNHDSNYNMIACTPSTVTFVEDNDYYTVKFNYGKDNNCVYDKNPISFNAIVRVRETNEEINDFTYNISLNGNTVSSIDKAGYYTITVKITAYEIEYSDTFTVEQRTLAISWSTPEFIYNGSDQKPLFTLKNIVEGDMVNGVYGDFNCKNAGDHVASIVAISGTDSLNYKLPDAELCQFEYNIAPYEINVNIDNKSSEYGDPLVALTYSTNDPLVNGDILSNIIKVSKADGGIVNENGYAITGECINENYLVNFTNGVYNITPRKITVTIDSLSSVYGENIKTLTASVTSGSILPNDTDVFRLEKASGTTVKEGGYAITGECINSNYDITFNSNAVYTIFAYTIKINVNDVDAIYGDTDVALSATLADGYTLVGSDTIDQIVSLERANGNDAGSYNITATKLDNVNYDVILVYTNTNHSVFNIKSRDVIITIKSANVDSTITWTELSNQLKYEITAGNVKEGDDLNISLTVVLSNGTALNADNFLSNFQGGEHSIIGTYNNPNYNVKFIEGTLVVVKPLVDVTGIETEFIYTGETINVFDWATNITGYLDSANENSFKASYYTDEDETPVDEIINAGTYKVVISIVHTHAYEFKSDAVTTYKIKVLPKNISDAIIIIGAENNGIYAYVEGIIARITDYEVILDKVLTKDGVEIASTTNLIEAGVYKYTVTVNDDNLCGQASITFRINSDIRNKIAQISAKLNEYKEADADRRFTSLLAIRDCLLELSDDDKALIAANDDYKEIIKICTEEWAKYIADGDEDFNVADKASHSNLPTAFLVVVSALSTAAWFALKKFLL